MFSWQLRQMTRVFRRRMAMVGSTGLVDVGQFPDVTDLKVRPGLAKLIAFGQEPMDQLVAPGAGQDRSLIDKDCRALPLQRDSAEAGDQWFPSSVAFDPDLQAGPRSDRCWHRHFVASGHLGDRGTVLTGQGFE